MNISPNVSSRGTKVIRWIRETGMLWVPVFFFIGLLLTRYPGCGRRRVAIAADPFSCPVHYEQSQARIDRIRADFEEQSESIDREIGRVRRLIIDADDPAVRGKTPHRSFRPRRPAHRSPGPGAFGRR